jgi:hypothetical protein
MVGRETYEHPATPTTGNVLTLQCMTKHRVRACIGLWMKNGLWTARRARRLQALVPPVFQGALVQASHGDKEES